jgi:hypothetical protein
LTRFQRDYHRALLKGPRLSIFQQPAIDNLNAGHAFEDAGHDNLSRELAIRELHLEFIPNFYTIQTATIDVSRVHQVIVTGDDMNVPVIQACMSCGAQTQAKGNQAEEAEARGAFAHKLWMTPDRGQNHVSRVGMPKQG